jgi:prepilin-type N-terminal cleavage/methylation domain-containing protein
MTRLRSKAHGFSLVELVIVVVIIGVIAAIAVPRISRGAKGAGDSALRGSLAGIRNAIDMYAAEHGGTFPAGLEADIIDKLTKKTDASGTVGTTAGVHIYGPYLRGGMPPLPVCTNKGDSSLSIVTGTPAGGTGTEGWVYSTDTGEFIANCADTELDEAGNKYNTY